MTERPEPPAAYSRRLGIDWPKHEEGCPRWLEIAFGPLFGVTMCVTLALVWVVFWLGLRSW